MKSCSKCGGLSYLVGDTGLCVFCEDTREIVIGSDADKDDGFVIVDRKNDKFCTKCGRKKKWVTVEVRKGPEWICPKC